MPALSSPRFLLLLMVAALPVIGLAGSPAPTPSPAAPAGSGEAAADTGAAESPRTTDEMLATLQQLLGGDAVKQLQAEARKEGINDEWLNALRKAGADAGVGEVMNEVIDGAGLESAGESAADADAGGAASPAIPDPAPTPDLLHSSTALNPSARLQPSPGIEPASGLDQPDRPDIKTGGLRKYSDAEWRAAFPKKESAPTD